MATLSRSHTSSETSLTMVSGPSGLLTCLLTRSARRTMSRFIVILLGFALALPGAAARAAASGKPVILVYGDSLSAGYGIAVDKGWVSLLADRVHRKGYGFQVVNASVSGETTSGGLQRLPHALATHEPGIVILELGANDGLRGLPLEATRSNLDAMITLARQGKRRVLLVGMRMPPNYGERYTEGFAALFSELARAQRTAFVPFLMDGVAGKPELIQADGLHPNARAQPLLLDNVWPALEPLLRAPPL
jgi:acyl-CoA thioesterase I